MEQAADQFGQRLSFDKLHGIIMDAALAAGGEDAHDVRVLDLCCRVGFILEALQLLGVKRGGEGQHLQGHAAAQRDLLSLVDNAHAAPAKFAQEAVISQRALRDRGKGRRVNLRWRQGAFLQPRPRLLDELQAVQALCQVGGDVRVGGKKCVPVGPAPCVHCGQIFIQGLNHARIFRHRAGLHANGRTLLVSSWIHKPAPKTSRNWDRARAQRFLTLSRLRPSRPAISGKVSSSRWRRISTSR